MLALLPKILVQDQSGRFSGPHDVRRRAAGRRSDGFFLNPL